VGVFDAGVDGVEVLGFVEGDWAKTKVEDSRSDAKSFFMNFYELPKPATNSQGLSDWMLNRSERVLGVFYACSGGRRKGGRRLPTGDLKVAGSGTGVRISPQGHRN